MKKMLLIICLVKETLLSAQSLQHPVIWTNPADKA